MRIAFALFLSLHGAIHLAGFAKAFGMADVPQLVQPISRGAGTLWLGAGLLFVAAAVVLLAAPRHWWVAAVPAVLLSQALIASDFRDARLGTIANAIVLVPLALSLLDLRATSLRSRYEAEVRRAVAAHVVTAPPLPVTEAELAPLPPLVQTYLRRAGVVGKPHVRSFHAVFRARIRSRPGARWMAATVEQDSFYGAPGPARLFFMVASRAGVPFVAFHRYVGDSATMQVRVAGLVEVVNVSGPEMTRSETVTLFNDMCLLAPGALVDAGVRWQPLGQRQVKGTFSNAGQTISAVLTFDQAGDLVGFVSSDRFQSDGKTHRLLPWSTPVHDFRDFPAFGGLGGVRLAASGEARWREPAGEWAYAQLELQRITYNPGRGSHEDARP